MKTYVTVVLVGLLFLSLSYSTRSKESILDLPTDVKMNIARLLPQGWAFFTKDAREPVFETYKLDESGKPCKVTINNVHRENLYGISRYSRRVSYEATLLLNAGGELAWEKVKGEQFPTVASIPVTYIFSENIAVKNLEDGTYVISKEEPIPWSWHANFQKENTRKEYTVINFVNCKS